MGRPQIVNDPHEFVVDAIRGYVATTDDVDWVADPGFLVRRPRMDARVALVSGGGSGHEPLHAGFVGAGMLSAAVPGRIFSSPNAVQVAAAIAAVDGGQGVLLIVKNYTGDVMNFAIARRLAADSGIAVDEVLVDDDTATEGEQFGPGRRGTAAAVVVEKICGAAAAEGRSLTEVAEIGRAVVARSRSMAVALRAPTLPGGQQPSFDLPDDLTEVGIGIHGERGVSRAPATDAHGTAETLLAPIVASLGLADGDKVILLVNNLGALHPLELSLLASEALDRLAARGIMVQRALVGTFVTAFDMAGASLTLTRCDDEVLRLWDAPTAAPAWPNGPSRRPPVAPPAAITAPGLTVDDGTVVAAAGPGDLGHDAVVGWLDGFVRRVLAHESELTELDRRTGDGDFGLTQAAALTPVPPLAELARGRVAPALFAISESYLRNAGGTSGALFGMLFRCFGRAAEEAGIDGMSVAAIGAGARDAYDVIRSLGGADRGDCTMLDALGPAVDVLTDPNGTTGLARIGPAAASAGAGADATASLRARRGRASYVGRAAVGVVDPGALVVAWLFDELATVAAGEAGAS